ncbi:MAG TPA: protease modulator HflC [Alphaproteobacteria bacterium]|nr:protease modulator HflC [Alphaproteobacteria bacterium]HAJ48429.1 protease modulator HflC [Alphaproteobacteria bacterium]
MNNPFLVPAIVIAVFSALLLIYSSTFIVSPARQALVIRFGNPVREVKAPGLYFKLPMAEEVRFFDKRNLELRGVSGEVTLADQKRVNVEAFARYRITNPLQFFRTLRDPESARTQLQAQLSSQLRNGIGSVNFQALLTEARGKLMANIRQALIDESKNLGIEIVDVRIRSADLPPTNQEAVFLQMQTRRQQQAAETRAKGNEDAQTRRAKADREVVVIRAEATRKSEILRGEGDAERNKILGEAYGKDANFFAYYRSLKAYEASLGGDNTTMLLSPDSPFFKYFRQNPGQVTP